MTFLTSKIMYDRTAKNDVPGGILESSTFHLYNNVYNHDVGNRFDSQPGILRFRSCNNGNSVRCVLLYAAWNARRAHSREKIARMAGFSHGARWAVSTSKVVVCVVRSFDIPVYTRETRYAAWILTRRNCTHNCDAIRSIIMFDSIINVGHLLGSRTR